jgi:hypothetical protein
VKKLTSLLLILLLCPLPTLAQYTRQRNAKTAVVIMSGTLSKNGSSTGIVVTPSRKQLGNFGTGCSGGVIQPSGDPVGQLYATAAIKAAAESASPPCATQGVVSTTISSGSNIASPDNGHSAGGSDSVLSMTNQYGLSSWDSYCTGDTHNSDPTLFPGLSPAGCSPSGSAYFFQTTAPSHGNADTLFPTNYASNSVTIDNACCYMRSVYLYFESPSTIWDWEQDVNVNSSPTAYAQAGCTANHGTTKPCGYFGWGTHYGRGIAMWATCPQNCSGWHKMIWKNMRGGADVTTWVPIVNHIYHVIQYGHRDANCTYKTTSNCYFYDFMTVYDVTAGATPQTYYIIDSTTGGPAGGIPVNHSTWSSGLVPQTQIDMTTANSSTGVRVVSDTTVLYNLQ